MLNERKSLNIQEKIAFNEEDDLEEYKKINDKYDFKYIV
jgi:hypothetical protein